MKKEKDHAQFVDRCVVEKCVVDVLQDEVYKK